MAGTGQPEPDGQNWKTEEQYRQKRIGRSRTGRTGQAKSGQAEEVQLKRTYNRTDNMIARTGQEEQDCHDRTSRTGLAEQDRQAG
jgi:hypothetical protein